MLTAAIASQLAGAPNTPADAAGALEPYAVIALVGAVVGAAYPLSLLHRRCRQRARNLKDLYSILLSAPELDGLLDARDVANRCSAVAMELCDADRAAVYLRTINGLRRTGQYGRPIGNLDDLTTAAIESGRIVRDGTLVVPIRSTSRLLGGLFVPAPRRQVDEFLLAEAELLADHAAAALSRIDHVSALSDPTRVDLLTGALRSDFVPSLVSSLAVGDGMLLVQADHASVDPSDRVTLQVGWQVQAMVRPGDAVARCDRNTFLVHFQCLRAPLDDLAARLLNSWRATHPNDPISIGAATRTPLTDPLATLDEARAALDMARAAGGDRAIVASAGRMPPAPPASALTSGSTR